MLNPAGDGLGGWAPSLGARTFGGWATTALYVFASIQCFWAGRRVPSSSGGRDVPLRERARNVFSVLWAALRQGDAILPEQQTRALWFLLSGCMLLCGLSRAVDVGTLLTALGRHLALVQHWYVRRRILQVALMAGIGILALIAIFWLVRRRGMISRYLRLALAGAMLDFCFVSARAVSYHYFDRLVEASWGGIRLSWICELSWIGLVAGAAAAAERSGSGSSPSLRFNSSHEPIPEPERKGKEQKQGGARKST
jgi:hypothetical protein